MVMETITLRTTPYTVEKAAAAFGAWLTDDVRKESGHIIEIFQRCPSTGDFLVLLKRFGHVPVELSRFGLMIVRFLEQFGAVQHTLWISESDIVSQEPPVESNTTAGV